MTIVNMVGGGGDLSLQGPVEVGYGIDKFITTNTSSGGTTGSGSMDIWNLCGTSVGGTASDVRITSRKRYAFADGDGKPRVIYNGVRAAYNGSIFVPSGVSSLTISAGTASTGNYSGIPSGTTGTAYLNGAMVKNSTDVGIEICGVTTLFPVKVRFDGTKMVTTEDVTITSFAYGWYANAATRVGAYVIYVVLD